jgi:hypothetical protein
MSLFSREHEGRVLREAVLPFDPFIVYIYIDLSADSAVVVNAVRSIAESCGSKVPREDFHRWRDKFGSNVLQTIPLHIGAQPVLALVSNCGLCQSVNFLWSRGLSGHLLATFNPHTTPVALTLRSWKVNTHSPGRGPVMKLNRKLTRHVGA